MSRKYAGILKRLLEIEKEEIPPLITFTDRYGVEHQCTPYGLARLIGQAYDPFTASLKDKGYVKHIDKKQNFGKYALFLNIILAADGYEGES